MNRAATTNRLRARRAFASACALLLCASALVTLAPAPRTRAQVRPVYSRGAAGLGHLLQRLQTTASAMHTAAHPDDEDSALIARLARGDHARVTYLALNRGEGGQNIIGPELFEPLGVIRTEELLQARRLDGGTQMFTRTFDYGFSKTRDEAAQKWGERLVLGDIVRAIRTFRPLVIVSRFSGTPADGHGQHQLAGYLTPLAFRAAADPKEFPEQISEGLLPWQARKLYVGQGFRPQPGNEPTTRIQTGILDPLTGRTFFEIAAEGRSQHKSQEMGSIEPRGAQSSNLRLIESKVITAAPAAGTFETDIFAGLDTSISGIPKLVGYDTDALDAELKAAQQSAAQALAGYDALAPGKIIRPLAEGLTAIRRAMSKLPEDDGIIPEKRDVSFLLAQKEEEFAEALRRAAGVEVDTLMDAETIVAGDAMRVTVRVFVPEGAPVKLSKTFLRLPSGWQARATDAPPEQNQGFRFYRENATQTAYFELRAPADAPLTQPYWLDEPRDGNVFRWSEGDPRCAPFAPPLVASETAAEIGGVSVTLAAPAQYRYADDIRGEIRRDLNVVPRLSVAFDSDLLIAPVSASAQSQRLAVRVINNAPRASAGRVSLRLPEGWTATPASQDFSFAKRGERASLFFDVTVPANARGEGFRIAAEATADEATYARTMHTVAYPHIQTHRYYTDALIPARVFDFKLADKLRVGYVMGSGDEVPAAIRRMGADVTLLEEQDLATGDLARFDCVVIGIRASEVRPDFVANNRRLLAYAEQGGTLVVQYQRPDYLALNLAPFPAKMASRVTDETAPVKILEPSHPAFTYPNRITADDFRGWVQERDLYAFTEFDGRYTPLLETADPNEPAQRGGQVYARLGRGHFVYTSYAWFRQLPAGVPGAYRQFANLLSLSKAPAAR